MEPKEPKRHRRKGGFTAPLVAMAVLGVTVATALGVSPFYAEVGGSGTFQSGTLILSKTVGSTTCLSSPNTVAGITTNVNTACSSSDLGSATNNDVGSAQTASVVLTNQGNINSTGGLVLAEGSCTVSANPYTASANNPLSSGSDTSGFCSKVDVTIYNGTKCIYPAGTGACPSLSNTYNLSTLASVGNLSLASTMSSGAAVTLTVTTELDTTATNADQGLTATIPLNYTLSQ
jgi:hypothetical protein